MAELLPNESLNLIFTPNYVAMPGLESTLQVSSEFNIAAAKTAFEASQDIIICTPLIVKNSNLASLSNLNNVFRYAVSAKIVNLNDVSKGSIEIKIKCQSRVYLTSLIPNSDMTQITCTVSEVKEIIVDEAELQKAYSSLVSHWSTIFVNANNDSSIIPDRPMALSNLYISSYIFGNVLIKNSDEKMNFLGTISVLDRYTILEKYLNAAISKTKISDELNARVQEAMEKNQREYYLREKMKATHEMLKEFDGEDADSVYAKRLSEGQYPDNIKKKINYELNRLKTMSAGSMEGSVARTYIEWLLNLPWWQEGEDKDDLKDAMKILNEDHYGLTKQKERIIEYLAVKRMTKSLKAPILCLYGPPGVGKTSLAISIARAINRKFIKVSLGGISDEAEIRGHRRTYIGALPGKIIQGMVKAEVKNPLFLFDEVDKIDKSYHGDPSSALLEVLDPEQNANFQDNYIEESYDLSNVLFICTANSLDGIPGPLRDRLELIEVNSYTKLEKMHIAKEHLIALELEANGLTSEMITFDDAALDLIIEGYTREAGVRDLRRKIGAIMRKFAVELLNDSSLKKTVITKDKVIEYLKKPIFEHTKASIKNEVGIVTGLAYTEYGGEVLPIEVNYFEGKGAIIKTGNLGKIMNESAEIAYDYVKSNAKKYGINPTFFAEHDIHIHAPEGAVPKDGPSAGVALTLAIISAITGIAIKGTVAMTGEVNLRGDSMPIGGLREKTLAALREHIEMVLVPKENLKDVEELPDEIKENLKIVLVSNVDEALALAFTEPVKSL